MSTMPFRASRLAWFSKDMPKKYKEKWLNHFGKITTSKKNASWYFVEDPSKIDQNTAKFFTENDVLLYKPELMDEFVKLDIDINDDFSSVSYAEVVEPHVVRYGDADGSDEESGVDPYNRDLWESGQQLFDDDEDVHSSVRTQESAEIVNGFMHVREGDSHTFALCDIEVFDPRNTECWTVRY
eukprot:m.89494 g.89494  ORF g.89494 m.89494 type:complete len:183 (-) comp16439_c0_seq1:714-1262(-)